MIKARQERGQAIVLVVVSLVALLGMAALVLDVGFAWYAKRQLQASVDAAALAGAQDLPNVATAIGTANTFAGKNTPNGLTNVSYTITTKCTAAAATCAPANAVVVSATANSPTWFAKVLGISQFNLSAQATACQPCGTAPADIVLVIDRTGSMCQPTGAGGVCIDLDNAKAGIRTMLGLLEPPLDQIGMVAFPPVQDSSAGVCSAPYGNNTDQVFYDSASRVYLTDPLGGTYKNPDGSLNQSSGLYLHTTPGDPNACITDGGNTSYSQALQQGMNELNAHGRAGIPKIIVFMTDGEANIGPVYGSAFPANGPENQSPCHTAISTANAIKAQGVTIYAIGYDLKDPTTGAYAYCDHGIMNNGHHQQGSDPTDRESPNITSYQTLQQISSPGDLYNQPSAGQLDTIFTAIAADISSGTSRLVDDTY